MKSMKFVFMMLSLVVASVSFAQKRNIEHVWLNEEKTSKIEIYKATDGKFYGKIVWLKEPNENGKPRIDSKNPDAGMKNKPVMNLIMLRGFTPTDDAKIYTEGTVYDPRTGKTYCGKMTCEGTTLKLKGFICSVPLLGKTNTWTLVQ